MVALGAASLPAQNPPSERSDSWQWYVGPQGGVMLFETPSQTRSGIPVAGGHLLVIARHAGLKVSFEEAIGNDELSAIPSGTGTAIDVTFNNIRRYSGVLTIFPWSGGIQPYLGMGFGIQHVVHPNVEGVFGSQAEAAAAQQEADDRSGAGFVSGMVGLQLRPTNAVVLYGSYHLVSSAGDRLILGPTHTVSAGIRIGLGRWKAAW
jgi:hypothetical protein